MGTYNTVRVELECPRCGAATEVSVDCGLGYTNEMSTLAIGDVYPFRPGETPLSTDYETDGYAECPSCKFDFGCGVRIQGGRVAQVRSEPATLVHEHDAVLVAPFRCTSRRESVRR
jgi:hypothetical protein